MTVFDLLNPDSTEVEEQRVISAPGATTGDVLTVNADDTISPAPGGSSQPFAAIKLRTSLDFADPFTRAPVLFEVTLVGEATLTLPPSPFGDNGVVKVRVLNDGEDTFQASGELVVVKADGLAYLAQDGSAQTVPAGGYLDMDFPDVSVSLGAGLSWNAGSKQIDIASAGVYSAYAVINVFPTP